MSALREDEAERQIAAILAYESQIDGISNAHQEGSP